MFVPILRKVVLVITFIFAISVLGISAGLANQVIKDIDTGATFISRPVLPFAISGLTILTFPILFIVDLIRTGAFTSMVVFELSWLLIVSILWFVTGASAMNTFTIIFGADCTLEEVYLSAKSADICHEFNALGALSYSSAALLMTYSLFLFICATIGSCRGQKTWTSSVKEAKFFAPTASSVAPAYGKEIPGSGSQASMVQHAPQYPQNPVQHYQPTSFGPHGPIQQTYQASPPPQTLGYGQV